MRTKKSILLLLPFIATLLFLRQPTWAGQLHAERSAATASLDAADCQMIVSPGESIDAAIRAASNNTIICVRGGVYHESISIGPRVPATNKTGLTLIAYPGERPIIDGQKRIPSSRYGGRFDSLVDIGGNGTVFDGFEVRFSSARGLEVTGDNVTVRNSSIHDNWDLGLAVRHGTGSDGTNIYQLSGALIENNEVYNNLRKVRHVPVIYRGYPDPLVEGGWRFDPDETWDDPFWSGKDADLPDSSLNSLSMTFNDDGQTARIYAGSVRTTNDGHISPAFSANGKQIDYTGRDLLFFEPATQKWTRYFNGAALGIPVRTVIDAFQIDGSIPPESLPCPRCAPIVMSFDVAITLTISNTATAVGPSDLVRFQPTAMTPLDEITAGAFMMERTAAEMGLPAEANIDALDRAPDGRQLMSFANTVLTLGTISPGREDLVANDSPGVWSIYFDGRSIDYNPFADDLTAAWLDRHGNIYISGDPVGGSALTFIFARDSVARGNMVYNNYGEGLVAGRYTSHITLEDNITFDNNHANLYLNDTQFPLVQRNLIYCTDDREFWRKNNAPNYRPGGGLYVRDEDFNPMPPVSQGQVIINNIVAGCSTNLEISTQQPGGGLNNALIANNVFIDARADGVEAVDNVTFSREASYANSYFVNNLIVQNSPGNIVFIRDNPDFSTLTVANNLYSTAPPASWFPGESGRVVGNPAFVNGMPPLPADGVIPDPANYAIGYNSPAFDAGQPVAEVLADYFGQSRLNTGALDIGIYELPYLGRIIVTQATTPAGATQLFDYTASFAPNVFQLSDGQQVTSAVLDTGLYSVVAAETEDWATTAVCDDGSPADAIDLDPGETVTCAFSSTRDSRLIVRNELEPAGAGQLIDFTLTPGEAFQLGHDSRTFDVTAGAPLALEATTPEGWERTGATCDNGDAPANVTADPGEWVTCTFTHRQLGRVVVEKQTLPDGSPQSFAFSTSYDSNGFSLSDGQQNTSAWLSPGSYNVAETLPDGWAQTGATCDDGSPPGNIDLGAGETVTCVFTNARTALGITVTPSPASVVAPGDDVQFTVRVSNDGVTPLTLSGLTDSVYGNVADGSNSALLSTNCAVPESLPPGDDYTCAFSAHVAGAAGAVHRNTVTATAGSVTAAAEASVSIVAPATGRIVVIKQTDPADTPGSFNFTASYGAGGFTLSHGQSNDSGLLLAGATYSVAESVPTGWELASAVCVGDDDGNNPAAIVLDANETVTCTFTNRPVSSGPTDVIYVAANASATTGGVAFTKGDILAYDRQAGTWSMFFDGSDVGWTKPIGDFELLSDGSLLLTTSAKAVLGAGAARFTLQVHDIARFAPTNLGANTAGTFSLYFDGSRVGLSTSNERIDALAIKPDGTLLISTVGRATVKNGNTSIIAQDEDMLAFRPTALGANTSGIWNLTLDGFDGSLLAGMAAEDVNAAWFDPSTGDLYLTVMNAFTINGVSGNGKTVLKVTPERAVSVYWDAGAAGFSKVIDGLGVTRR